jgi:hypothetical protein
MIDHTPLFDQAVRFSWSAVSAVDIIRGGEVIAQEVPVVSGSVSCDRTSKTRWSSSMVLGLYEWQDIDINVFDTRFRVYCGISSVGHREMLQLGEYRVKEIQRNVVGQLSITGGGLEQYIIDDRFLRPRVPPTGQSTVDAIAALIIESVPRAQVRVDCTYDRNVTASAPWEKDRMDAILQLGDSIGADVFCGHDGVFVIQDYPNLVDGVPVYYVNEGDGGVLMNVEIGNTREKVYNAVSVSGESSSSDTPPVWGWAADDNPASATYWGGEYGHVPRFYSSQFLTTEAQCVSTAQSMLAESLASNRTVGFGSTTVPFLEAGDLVLIDTPDGAVEKHLINATGLDLGESSGMKMTTAAVKLDISDV